MPRDYDQLPRRSTLPSSAPASPACRRPGCCARPTTSPSSSRTAASAAIPTPSSSPGRGADRRRHRLHRLQRGELSQPHRAVRASRRGDPGRPRCRSPCRWTTAGSNTPAPASAACSPSGATCCGRGSGACCATCCASTARRPALLDAAGAEHLTLGDYLDANGYGAAFREDHLLPDGGGDLVDAGRRDPSTIRLAAFVRFFDNHGLLQLRDRPHWRTVVGGSRAYVERLTARFAGRIAHRTRRVAAICARRPAVRRRGPPAAVPSASTRW